MAIRIVRANFWLGASDLVPSGVDRAVAMKPAETALADFHHLGGFEQL